MTNKDKRKQMEDASEAWVMENSETRTIFCVIGDKNANATSCGVHGREDLIVEAIVNEMLSDEVVAELVLTSSQVYHNILEEEKKEKAQEINKMYNPLHEAPEQKFIEIANKIIFEKAKSSRLQELRKMAGLTQKKLADLSGVNLRTLQQYENQSKDINKASANTLLSLCKVLACDVKDICM